MPNDTNIIGRKPELKTLDRLYKSRKSEFAMIYGRRRVGKTFLVTRRFENKFTFRLIGMANATRKQQLLNFHTSIINFDSSFENTSLPKNWFSAFQMLIKLISKSKHKRKIIFFDELPWIDTPRSDFLSALEHFWNSWAALRSDILLIGCGSAASWMIKKIIRNKGGLHNRVTERIKILPFTLQETELFLHSKGAEYDRYQLLELYMTMGGVPFYLENIQPNRSIAQNIDRMFFTNTGMLRHEYMDLYRSLFTHHEKHTTLVETLAKKSKGMTRKELSAKTKIKDGGSFSVILEELEQSGFIKRYIPFGKSTRDSLYRLIDPYTLFYLTFVKKSKAVGEGTWLSQLNNPKWNAWSGYAFEDICIYHTPMIKKHLGISAVYTEVSIWKSKKISNGAQIDLILDRNDRVINICEIKFSQHPFIITKPFAENLKNKLAVFKEETNTTKTLLLTMITTFGLKSNKYSTNLVKDDLTMDALFD